MMHKILVSACLMGQKVRYHGGDEFLDSPQLKQWMEEGRVISLCPEVAAGLPTPRPPSELNGGDGEKVLAKHARVRNKSGMDVTAFYVKGAQLALELAKQHDIRVAILKENSPSCGTLKIYDGGFSGKKVVGMGVTAAQLKRHGIQVFSEADLVKAAEFLMRLDKGEVP